MSDDFDEDLYLALNDDVRNIEGHTGLHFLLMKKDDFVDFMKLL